MKFCKRCSRVLPLAEFSVRSKATRQPNAYCKECQRAYSKAHYAVHGQKHNKRRYENHLRYVARNRPCIMKYLSDKACVDCGLEDVMVLEFDHVHGVKRGNISVMIAMGVSWNLIAKELEQCVVRRANCHRRKTAREFKWFKADFGA